MADAAIIWQARVLRIDRPSECLRLFRANRDAGALIALAFFIASFAL